LIVALRSTGLSWSLTDRGPGPRIRRLRSHRQPLAGRHAV